VSQVTRDAGVHVQLRPGHDGRLRGSPAIGPDIENGLLLAILARPVRRSEVLLGRWLGLAIVLVAYAIVAGYLELGAVALATGYVAVDPLIAPVYLAGESLVLLTLAIVLSTRVASVAGGAMAVVAFGLAWMAGVMGGVGKRSTAMSCVGPASRQD